jgi:hypothetical protein
LVAAFTGAIPAIAPAISQPAAPPNRLGERLLQELIQCIGTTILNDGMFNLLGVDGGDVVKLLIC